MATKRVACPECSAAVPYGRLSCSTCGTLLASVAGSPRRVSLQPIVRRSRTSSVHAVAGNGRAERTHANGDDEDDRPVTSWREEELPGHAPALQGHRQPLDFASVLAARSAATDGALALAIDHPTNGTAPAPSMPSRLQPWDRPASSVAAWESMTTRAGHTVRDFVTSAAGVVATLSRTTVDTPTLEAPRQIPGAYLAPSATRLVELRPEAIPARTRRAASARAVPGLNHWYSVPDAPGDAPAGIMPAVVSLMPAGPAAMARNVRAQGTPPALTPAEIGLQADLPFATPNGPNGWATAVGSGLAALSVVLPWAKNGVAGGQLGPGYLAQWGLANPAYLLLLAAGLAMLLVTILPNRLPRALREVALPLLLGGFLLGLAWSYATGPFGTGTGVGTMVVGAALLVTGGALGLRRFRPSLKTDDMPA